ncbi:hypothetical protein ACFSHT_30710 [Paraburkholderia silviterrae]|uniref:Uncharacterized protein n=1 Tax=Paraburkholderia silviterrae TaxID=2528715 RepID=A0A4V2ZXU6_9BURK|nr:hypothetical protein [Paraburkholderia silviterrae]TDG16946.1 hypothetical protein EYW47_39290 [Paraburkholderia silviterrae]
MARAATGASLSQRSTLRTVLSIAAVFVAVWVVALLYWKTTWHVPSALDLLLYGLALPALLATGVVLARRALGPARPRPAAATRAADEPSTPAASEAAARQWTMALLDSSLRLPAGITPEEVGNAAREASVIGLHPELMRQDGVKIFASGIASLELDQFDESLLPDGTAHALHDEHRRALLLAAETLDELMERQAVELGGVGENAPASAAREAASLKLHLLLPQRWQALAPTLAAWLDAHLARERWMPRMERVRLMCVADPVQALTALDDLTVALQQQPLATRHVLVALDSSLGQQTVDTLDNLGQLYEQKHPDGHVLGEGACALLLAHPAAATMVPAAHLHRLVTAQLAGPIEQPAQQRGETLAQLLDAAREQAALPGLEIASCALVSDADQRNSRRAEVTSVVEARWPETETDGRCLHLGFANGESHAVLALSAVAVAGAHSLGEQQPTFALSNADASARGVMLVSPPPPQAVALTA